jgi:ESCRT-I complex subunit VPS28
MWGLVTSSKMWEGEVEDFMSRYRVNQFCPYDQVSHSDDAFYVNGLHKMDHPAALHRLKVGVPATVEHASESGGAQQTSKWVAEATQVRAITPSPLWWVLTFDILKSFINFMDAIKLRMRAKDQLYPMLQELVTSYSRFKGSKDLEGRGKMVAW